MFAKLQANNLGLTPSQWSLFCDRLDPQQLEILTRLKAGEAVESIAKSLQIKTNQVTGAWGKIYLAAQKIRGS